MRYYKCINCGRSDITDPNQALCQECESCSSTDWAINQLDMLETDEESDLRDFNRTTNEA